MQRVTPDIRDAFEPFNKALRESFVPALFQGIGEVILRRGVACLPFKQAGLALPDPTLTSRDNLTVSCVITGHITAELIGQE